MQITFLKESDQIKSFLLLGPNTRYYWMKLYQSHGYKIQGVYTKPWKSMLKAFTNDYLRLCMLGSKEWLRWFGKHLFGKQFATKITQFRECFENKITMFKNTLRVSSAYECTYLLLYLPTYWKRFLLIQWSGSIKVRKSGVVVRHSLLSIDKFRK